MAGLWAQAATNVDTNLFEVVNDLPDSLEGLANALERAGVDLVRPGDRRRAADRRPLVPGGA